MSERPQDDQVVKFMARVFGVTPEYFAVLPRIPDPPPPGEGLAQPRMAGVIAPVNQPEFWADAPWRIEPDQASIPVSFHVREANLQPPGNGPWRLDAISIEQRLADGTWYKLATLLPADLPDVDDQGLSQRSFWVHGTDVPLSDLHGVARGPTVHLRVVFKGKFPPYEEDAPVEIHLESILAKQSLPLGRGAPGDGPRHWFYGDTHYHSGYTNDVKEFGGAVPEARKAGRAIGLDWLVITDHSVDLDEVDPGYGGQTRWERLKADLDSPTISNDAFRIILGEEITLAGKGERYLHMLAFGHLVDMVEGAFLPEDGGFAADLVREALEKIIKSTLGYPADIPETLFGTIHDFETVLAMLPEETLTFAAHPYDVAQVPPAKWHEDDLANLRLTGLEFWNGRSRASASMTYDPFSRSAWTREDKKQQKDRGRIQSLKGHAQKDWDPHLQLGVEEWQPGEALPARRPVFIAGADAHGDFNYHVGWAWDYRKFEVNDNALGRARTVIHLPNYGARTVPEVPQILAALKKGSCVVTDGPILEFSLAHGGQVARMGEVLTLDGSGEPELRVVAHTTPEFGPVLEVDVITYFAGQRKKDPRRTRVQAGQSVRLPMDGAQCYCRLEAQSIGPTGESFCCFTNPIWVRATGGGKREMRVSFR